MPRTLLLALLCVSPCVLAQPTASAIADEITDNIATEYAVCAAYFAIAQGGMESTGSHEHAAKYKEASNTAAQFSLFAAQKTRSEEMAMNVTLARFEMNLKAMKAEIGNDYSNISLLINKHSTRCTEAMTDSEAFMMRWAEKVHARHGLPMPK